MLVTELPVGAQPAAPSTYLQVSDASMTGRCCSISLARHRQGASEARHPSGKKGPLSDGQGTRVYAGGDCKRARTSTMAGLRSE